MKKKNKRLRKSDAYHSVLSYLIKQPNRAMNYKQIAAQIEETEKEEVADILNLLVQDGKIESPERGKYLYIKTRDEISGILDFNQRGEAYLVSEGVEKDIKLKKGDTLDAFDGDEVKVRVSYSRKSNKTRAFVTEVIKRARTSFVATISQGGNAYFGVCESSKIHTDFFIPKEYINNAKQGDKVLLRFRDWPATAKNPYAKVIEVFGAAGNNATEMHAIVAEFGFRTKFEAEVEQAAAALPHKIPESEIKKRRDYRKISTFTIDPADAKDFDDALSIRKLEGGLVEMGVHIADVSHYVQTGDDIDKEAFNRGTSVYLVDRTIPMLPERLSNELCSLRPHEDSLCFAVIFTLNEKSEVLKYEFTKTLIYSDHRFSYEQAQEVIEQGKGIMAEELLLLNKHAKQLRKARFANGAINFETTEFRFDLDAQGKPLAIHPKQRFDAHKLVEEFMLLANKYVAMHLYTKNNQAPIPYRVHEEPSMEKLKEFAETAATFGHKIDIQNFKNLSKSINEMVAKVEGTLEGDILQPLAIRSMEKAYYTTKKTGHFGLAFEYYAHFTSPIRRYPDMITHRMLNNYLLHKNQPSSEEVEKISKHSSTQEQKAVSAERASIKYKQTEYLSNFKGEEFEGIISGLTEWGIYVEIIENKCEGMIRINDIKHDNFVYYPELKKVMGRKTKQTYHMGQKIQIKVKQTNLQKRTIDFEFVK